MSDIIYSNNEGRSINWIDDLNLSEKEKNKIRKITIERFKNSSEAEAIRERLLDSEVWNYYDSAKELQQEFKDEKYRISKFDVKTIPSKKGIVTDMKKKSGYFVNHQDRQIIEDNAKVIGQELDYEDFVGDIDLLTPAVLPTYSIGTKKTPKKLACTYDRYDDGSYYVACDVFTYRKVLSDLKNNKTVSFDKKEGWFCDAYVKKGEPKLYCRKGPFRDKNDEYNYSIQELAKTVMKGTPSGSR